jgi:hypothetical protein
MFKKVWKKLDSESRFVGTGGPVAIENLTAHLTRAHEGAGQVEQAPGPDGQRTFTKLQRPAPLDKFGE